MTILQPNILTGHILNYIKRYDTAIDSIELIDEQENTKVIVTGFSQLQDEYYTTITFDINEVLIAYRFYMLRILDIAGGVLYSEKCFSTDQPINDFSVNDGAYIIDQGTTNDYIIYEQ